MHFSVFAYVPSALSLLVSVNELELNINALHREDTVRVDELDCVKTGVYVPVQPVLVAH